MRGSLLTGVTGFLGRALLPRLLARDSRPVYCLIRAANPAELAERRAALLDELALPAADVERVVAIAGDLARAGLGLGGELPRWAERVDEVFHVGATTRFDLTLAQARRANVRGVAQVLELARRAAAHGGFRRFHAVSTAYLGRELPDGTRRFRNHYEQSKWEAEQLVWAAAPELPVTVYRPSIVMGDSRTGWTPHFRVLYEPMKWIYLGKLGVFPAPPSLRFDVVPVDYVCDALLAIGARPDSVGRSYRLTAGWERTLPVQEMLEIGMEVGNETARRIGEPTREMPSIVDPASIGSLEGEVRQNLERVFQVAHDIMRIYLPYVVDQEIFESPETDEALAGSGIVCPPLRDYLPALVRYGVEHRFGTQ
jgi:nucleoside-diphosphate-sugar epimerase